MDLVRTLERTFAQERRSVGTLDNGLLRRSRDVARALDETDRRPHTLCFRTERLNTRRRVAIQTSQRRSEFDAVVRSNAARRQSRDDASRSGCGNDSAVGNRTAGNGYTFLPASRNITEII